MNIFFRQNAFKIILFSLILVPLAVYWQTTKFSFVWDDEPLYMNEKHFPREDRFANFSSFWKPNNKEMYAPVTYSFWSFAALMGGKGEKTDPTPFHLVNVTVHIINTILIFLILFSLINEAWFACLGALLFSLHPIQVESVAWASELRGLLAAMFGFYALLAFLNYRKDKPEPALSPQVKNRKKNQTDENTIEKKGSRLDKKYYFIMSIAGVLLSVLSKPTGVVFPLIILTIDVFLLKNSILKSLKSLWLHFLIITPFLFITSSGESSSVIPIITPLWSRPLFLFDSTIFYITHLFYPLALSPVYGRTPEYLLSSPWLIISAIIFTALILASILTYRKNRNYFVALLIFIIGFLPLSGLVSYYFQYWSNVADRYIYISMFGAALAFVTFLQKFKSKDRTILYSLALLLVLLIFSAIQLQAWQNEESLWTMAIERHPYASAQPYNARGYIYLEQKRTKEAIADFDKAISINAKEGTVYYNRGNAYFDLQEYNKAASDFSMAIKFRKDLTNAYVNRALCYEPLGRLNEAVDDLSIAILREPAQEENYVNRGVIYAKLGFLEKAKNDFRKALKLNSGDKEADFYLKEIEKEQSARSLKP